MSKKAKSLLIHNDTVNNKISAVVADEKNLAEKAEEFFKKISKESLGKGVVLKAEGNNTNYAVAYEKENFIIVSKKGSTKSARLYGNWSEALNFAREIIAKQQDVNKNLRFVLAELKSN